MRRYAKIAAAMLVAVAVGALTACGSTSVPKSASVEKESGYSEDEKALTFNNSKWNYDADHDVYWQIKVQYCAKPAALNYETMAVYVPGAYLNGIKNADGTYTCTVNESGKAGDYTAETAPIVFPINTSGYSAQPAPDAYSYEGISSYLKEGYVYVYAGMRGRDNGYDENKNLLYSGGAPWGVTDLKAAIRYYRYNSSFLPGDMESVFTFGHSGGGAQSAIMGASGDSGLYDSYLESIGAAMYDKDGATISDAVSGAMCWCPITNLDSADEAYEWNMGQYFSTGTRKSGTWTAALSDDLAASYATYINQLGLIDENGNDLTLKKTKSGIYTAGSYYDYLLDETEISLNNFLSDTKFPYTESTGVSMGDGGFAGGTDSKGNGGLAKGAVPPQGNKTPSAAAVKGTGTKTYATPQAYIKALNSDSAWIEYNAQTNSAQIISLKAFVTHCKKAAKDVGAFDAPDRSQPENNLFGNDANDSLHFDSILYGLIKTNAAKYAQLSGWNPSLLDSFASDLKQKDKFGHSLSYRMDMYNPMYYLSPYYDGYATADVAKYWRIRTGIDQTDTALTTETNLKLALQQYDGVQDIDFATVWDQGHTMAERTGNSTDNFIKWVNDCMKDTLES